MIEINLLPEELKLKTKGRNPDQVVVKSPLALIQDRVFIYIIPVILVLFILVHLFFAVLFISKNGRLVSLNHKWMDLATEKKALDAFNREFSVSPQDAGLLAQLNRQRSLWAQKLNKLSLCLPAGVWFSEIIFNKSTLTIRGCVISLQKDEVSLINKLLDSLKTVPEFSNDFTSLELSNIQKRSLGGYDISDFILVGTLRPNK
ncbi:MAG: PilN domain-containing protein [Candidatus Omnitrophica bacterium]|nr:PilN domain-containing protein [Candidatus Omnitrophota bacterium]